MDALRMFWYIFWDPTPYGARARGPWSKKKCNFGKIQNGHQRPYFASEKKVQKTKKFSLNELHMKCAKNFDFRSKAGLLEQKNDFYVFEP